MTDRTQRRHLRDAAAICPVTSPCPGGDFRCELDAGHDGQHKDGCTHWGPPAPRPCTATFSGRYLLGGGTVTCTGDAGHPGNHVGPRQGSVGRALWEDWHPGATSPRNTGGTR